jgi:yeast amino acid transporter
LFVGSGEALANGGPAAVVLGYLIIGVLMICTVLSLGELAIMYPVNGAFYEYSIRFIDDAWYVLSSQSTVSFFLFFFLFVPF